MTPCDTVTPSRIRTGLVSLERIAKGTDNLQLVPTNRDKQRPNTVKDRRPGLCPLPLPGKWSVVTGQSPSTRETARQVAGQEPRHPEGPPGNLQIPFKSPLPKNVSPYYRPWQQIRKIIPRILPNEAPWRRANAVFGPKINLFWGPGPATK